MCALLQSRNLVFLRLLAGGARRIHDMQSLVNPPMDMLTHMSSWKHRPLTITPYGQQQLIWRKMHEARKQNAHSTPIEPRPLHSNLQSTTPSQGLTPNASARWTHPKHSHALVAPISAHHNTSPGNAHSITKHVLTMQFTPMGIPYLTPPFTTPIPTNSSPSSEIAVLCRVLLTSDPQWK
jgi:hypothetical protein